MNSEEYQKELAQLSEQYKMPVIELLNIWGDYYAWSRFKTAPEPTLEEEIRIIKMVLGLRKN